MLQKALIGELESEQEEGVWLNSSLRIKAKDLPGRVHEFFVAGIAVSQSSYAAKRREEAERR